MMILVKIMYNIVRTSLIIAGICALQFITSKFFAFLSLFISKCYNKVVCLCKGTVYIYIPRSGLCQCNSEGVCPCKATVVGKKCATCAPGKKCFQANDK